MKITLKPVVTYTAIIDGKTYEGFVRQGDQWNGFVKLASNREGKVLIVEEPMNVKQFFRSLPGDGDDISIADEDVELIKMIPSK